MGLAQRDTGHHTYGDYLSWPEDVRYELADGVAYLMAPAPTPAHQHMAGEIFAQLRNALRGQPCRALIAPVDVLLPRAHEADATIDTVVQPDVFVVCDSAKIGERRVRGAPDLVVEVLSPSTASHDMILKRRLYERSGVRELWLVHPGDRVLSIYRLRNGEYGKPDTLELKGRTPVGVLEGASVDWDEILPGLPAAAS
jgi:Uma2 family endonuclease